MTVPEERSSSESFHGMNNEEDSERESYTSPPLCISTIDPPPRAVRLPCKLCEQAAQAEKRVAAAAHTSA